MRKIKAAHHKAFKLALANQGKNDAFAWVNPVMAAGWFIGTISIFVAFQNTFLHLQELALVYGTCSALLFLIPYKWLVKFVLIRFAHWNFFCFVGLAPFFTGLFLAINWFGAHSPTTYTLTRTYVIHHKTVMKDWELQPLPTLDSDRVIKKIAGLNATGSRFDSVTFSISEGAFQYPVITHYEFHK